MSIGSARRLCATRARAGRAGRLLIAIQLAPASLLLNKPLDVTAQTRFAFTGSTASTLTSLRPVFFQVAPRSTLLYTPLEVPKWRAPSIATAREPQIATAGELRYIQVA